MEKAGSVASRSYSLFSRVQNPVHHSPEFVSINYIVGTWSK